MADTILITGGCGFIGSHLVEHFLTIGYDVVVLDRLDSTTSLNRLTSIEEWDIVQRKLKFVWWDLKAPLSPYVIREIGKVDYIIHCAASSHVDRSVLYPMLFVMDNIVGTANILDYARGLQPKKFILTSTDEVMGSAPDGVEYMETDAMHPENPYSATKASAESLVKAYACTYGVNALIVRLMNVYGIKQNWEKFIPSTIRKVVLGEKVTIHSDSSRKISGSRYYIHVEDVCAVMELLLQTDYGTIPTIKKRNKELGEEYFRWGWFDGTYHVIGQREVSNLELARMIAEIMHKPLQFELVDYHSSRPEHDLRYSLSGKKLKVIGWTPKIPIEEALESVVDWYIQHPAWLGL